MQQQSGDKENEGGNLALTQGEAGGPSRYEQRRNLHRERRQLSSSREGSMADLDGAGGAGEGGGAEGGGGGAGEMDAEATAAAARARQLKALHDAFEAIDEGRGTETDVMVTGRTSLSRVGKLWRSAAVGRPAASEMRMSAAVSATSAAAVTSAAARVGRCGPVWRRARMTRPLSGPRVALLAQAAPLLILEEEWAALA